MRYFTLFSAALFSVALPFFTSAEHLGHSARRHTALANRKRGDLQTRGQSGARATFYDVGLGACGAYNKADDFIVALNAEQFGSGFPGPECFKMITITYKGKSTQAQIMDRCPGCPFGGLDMSRGLFEYFESAGTGVFYMDWSYNDGGDAPPPPKTTKKPKPSSTWTPPTSTSSTWSDPSPWTTSKTKTSSTWSFSSTSASSSSSSSSTTSSSSSSKTSSSSSAAPSATPTPVYGSPIAPQNLQGLNALVGALGKFVVQYAA